MQHGSRGSDRYDERGGGRGGSSGGYDDGRYDRGGSSDYYERDYERRYRDHGEYGGGSQRDSRGGEYEQRGGDGGRWRDHGGGGYDRGVSSSGDRFLNDARKHAWRKPSSVNATGAATGAEAVQNADGGIRESRP
jgi:hypothetical protein